MGILHKITFIPRFIRQFLYKQLNRIILWSADVNFGKNVLIYNRFYLKKYKGATFRIGNNFLMYSGESINPISRNIKACIFINNNADLSIGDNVGMSSPCIWCDEKITIGNNTKLGALVTVLDTDCHSLDFLNRRLGGLRDSDNTSHKPVVIGNDVLVGAHSIILKGVHIGDRTVIGAGSVVTNDIPSDCIASGNPCKIIRRLD